MARSDKKANSELDWLTGMCRRVTIPLPRAPVPMARRFLQIVNAISVEAFAGYDITIQEFAVLSFLRREPGLDQIGLAARMGIDRTNMGLVADQMEKRGLIERPVNPKDRRARVLRLTNAGIDLRDRMTPLTVEVRDKVFAPLSEAEREMFYELLERIIAANEHYNQPGAGRRKRSR